MLPYIKSRLSILSFLITFIPGTYFPIISLYLKEHLHFNGLQTGIILSMSAIASFVSPLITLYIAENIISVELLFILSSIISAFALILLYFQQEFIWVLLAYSLYMLISIPSSALANTIMFEYAPDSKRHFGNIRLWGTIGWIVAGISFSFFWLKGNQTAGNKLADAFILSAIVSIILGIYAITLPRQKIQHRSRENLLLKEALQILLKKEILLLTFLCFLVIIIFRYYFLGMAPYLVQLGVAEKDIMPIMSVAQVAEVFAMAFLGTFLVKTNFRIVLSCGLIALIWQLITFTMVKNIFLIVSGILCHGIVYTFFFTGAYIYIDTHCNRQARAGIQQLLSIIISGFAPLIGSISAGFVLDKLTSPITKIVNYQLYWTIPLILVLTAFILFFLFFRGRHKGVIK